MTSYMIKHCELMPKSQKTKIFLTELPNMAILRKMASVKTNKNKNPTPLLKTNFSWLETLLLGPKRFLHSKGPKKAILLMDTIF